MGNPATDALSFLLGTLFDLYAMVVGVRFIMQTVRADYYNPLAQFVVKVTDPLLKPLRRIIPGVGGYDVAALLLCLVVFLLKMLAFKVLGLGSVVVGGFGIDLAPLGIAHLVGLSFVDLVNLLFNIFIFAGVVYALLSWIAPDPNNPVVTLLQSIINPVVTPIRRVLPAIGGLDLSIMAMILALYVGKILAVGFLIRLVGMI